METVELAMSWQVFWGVAFAVVAGHAIYDLLWEVFAWSGRKGRDAALDLWDWWVEKDPAGLPRRLWVRAVGEPTTVDEPSAFVPDPDNPEKPIRESRWRVTSNGTLHRSTCRVLKAGLMFSAGYPWPWADTEAEARHYAEVQELRPCGACHPCGDLEGVEKWWK